MHATINSIAPNVHGNAPNTLGYSPNPHSNVPHYKIRFIKALGPPYNYKVF